MTRRDHLSLVLFAAAVMLAGCVPGSQMVDRVDRLPDNLQDTVREAVWAHGDPYNWAEQSNLVLKTRWIDYRHGFRPMRTEKVYTIDLAGNRMRIDEASTQTVSMFDGATWRFYLQGRRIEKPAEITRESVGYLALMGYAAGEMRTIRTFFSLPFRLLDPGVHMEAKGKVESPGGANHWDVVRVTFDPASTGLMDFDPSRSHYQGDRLLVYFNPQSDRIDRVFCELADAPFYAIPHWGEWSDYRRTDSGIVLPHRLDFRMTDELGGKDLGRRLAIEVDQARFNADLPAGIFSDLDAGPPELPETPVERVKRLGRDVIDEPASRR